MRTIVTGGAGFIGSHVAEALLAEGHDVLVIDDLSGGFLDNVPAGSEFERRSVSSNLDALFSTYRPDLVYHLAAYAAECLSHHIPVFNYQDNLVATANVLASAYRNGARHFVFTSSIGAYGHPPTEEPFTEDSPCRPCDPYGVAKHACENHIRAFCSYFGAPSYTVFRPHNVFGPRQNISDPYRNVVGIFMYRAMRGEPLPVFGDGTQTRSFSYINLVARCIAEAPFVNAARNQVFNVGGDQLMTVIELAKQVACVMGVSEDSVVFLEPRKEVKHAHCDHAKARRAFSHVYSEEIDIAGGLERTAAFVRARPVPQPTECPAPIEIFDQLPPNWAARLVAQEDHRKLLGRMVAS